jgi:hypothetical protein
MRCGLASSRSQRCPVDLLMSEDFRFAGDVPQPNGWCAATGCIKARRDPRPYNGGRADALLVGATDMKTKSQKRTTAGPRESSKPTSPVHLSLRALRPRHAHWVGIGQNRRIALGHDVVTGCFKNWWGDAVDVKLLDADAMLKPPLGTLVAGHSKDSILHITRIQFPF